MSIELTPQAFWDVNMHTLDDRGHAAFIIARVLQYGTLADIKTLAKHYQAKDFAYAIAHTRGIMDEKTLALATLLAQ